MFALFYSIYYSMFVGSWNNYTLNDVTADISNPMNMIIRVLTNMFNNTTTNLDTWNLTAVDYIKVISLILALITSIGIVVMAVKGIKRIFSVFFYGVR